MNKSELDVVGIGNAIVDVLVKTKDSFLEKHSLIKGSMTLINELQAQSLYSEIKSGLETSGGSVANTLAGIAELGSKTAFIGRVSDDKLGDIFKTQIRSSGTIFNTLPSQNGPSTARCLIFVTPDAQRTMCTYLGASVEINPEDLDLSIVSKAKVLYLEGYLWDDDIAKKTFKAAAKAAKSASRKVALSLSDSFCVERHRESFLELVENDVDILFANEFELISLYQSNRLEEALSEIKGRCEIAAITCGERGSKILSSNQSWEIEPVHLGNLIDTTGAGDLYASGFLHGYTNGKELRVCGEIGSICAGHIVTRLGSSPSSNLAKLVEENLK